MEAKYGAITLFGVLFQATYASSFPFANPFRLQFGSRGPQIWIELLPLRSPLLRQSSLISFPPLSNMLKFSGCSCLISDADIRDDIESCFYVHTSNWISYRNHWRVSDQFDGSKDPHIHLSCKTQEESKQSMTAELFPCQTHYDEFGGYQTLKQTCWEDIPPAPVAFKDLMIRGILQFALRIAFCCALHRYGNQDIHRWKFSWLFVYILWYMTLAIF